MKTIKFSTLLFSLCMFLFTSCVKDDDFELPDVSIKIPPFKGEIISLKEAVKNSSETVQTYKENHAIEGYVISSDQGGNYYDKIYLQTIDGKDGFSIAIKKSGLYGEFPIGTKVQLRLLGMTTQVVNNKLEAGYEVYKETSVGKMPVGVYKASVINTGESIAPEELTHEIKTLKGLDKAKFLNRLITIKRVAFEPAAVGKPYHQKSNDKIYGTNYKLLDSLGGSLIFRTSKFAKYATKIVPKEKVNVTGIITKYKTTYQFQPNTLNDIEIIEGTNGGDNNSGTFKPKTVSVLNEKFDEIIPGKSVSLEGWYSEATKGNRNWQGKEFKKAKFLNASAYKSNLDAMEAWIVTPGLDMSKATHKNFTFESQAGFSKDEKLEVFVSSDFDYKKGIEAAKWKKLEVLLAEKNKKGYSAFTNSGDIDLSAYTGVVYVAFKYSGNGKNATGTWNIDNVKFNYTPDDNEGDDNFSAKTVTELNETFDAVTSNKDVTLEGWYSKAAKGNRNWQGKDFKNNKFLQASAYKSNLEAMEAWIITPGLDLTAAAHKNFTFESQAGFSKNETLEVFISSNFDYKKGIETATWEKVTVTLAEKNSGGYSQFVSTGDINLSSYNGVVHIAFKYTGNSKSASGTWRIDNVKFNYADNNDGGDDNNGNSASELYFSEYGEGSSSNKYIEIYNGTDAEIDLSQYSIELYTNGATKVKKALNFEAGKKLAKGKTYVIYNGKANEQIKSAGDEESTVTWFNGDDAIVLKKGTTIIDVIGKVGEDPGKAWDVAGVKEATQDHTLLRKNKITKGNTNWSASAGTDANNSEWIVKEKDDFSNIGKR